jgi:hypothetical protein
MNASTADLVEAYVTIWEHKDLEGIGRRLHPDVRLVGPSLDLEGRQAVIDSIAAVLPLVRQYKVRSTFASDGSAMLAYDFVCDGPIGLCRTAELLTFEDGLVRSIELFYDARPFAQLAG